MFNYFLTKVFGSRNERLVKEMRKTVDVINALESEIEALSDDQLRNKTSEFKAQIADGKSLDSILPQAFAVVREASRRVLGLRHFDVQLIGGIVLHNGKITEMRTGEGKTLVATLPVYLNALSGKGVHVVTVNDYLARRDSEWMGRLYRFLGLSVGVVVPNQEPAEKYAAYRCDITYATNNELGFDYLRDNMIYSIDQKMQRELSFAVIDEVDSILIDEARTPLIISGPAEGGTEVYTQINQFIPLLTKQKEEDGPGDYSVDEKNKQISLTEEGHEKVENLLTQHGLLPEHQSLYDAQNLVLLHHVSACLRAHVLYLRDVDYIVRDGEVVIVDSFTGRTLTGRRWSDGLHQAIEAKEKVKIQAENQTFASITFQNYFRLYQKLSGMTGTADTEAYEFQDIYGLEVVVIPTNKPIARIDYKDLVFRSAKGKYAAIIEDIKACNEAKRPVLVGTTSIEVSEYLSDLLQKAGIKHEVLNAKQHEREALIVAQAGLPEAVTIATNMAGRGTDIVLGGSLQHELENMPDQSEVAQIAARSEWAKRHEQVVNAGGLHIIGSERHESRRIDNQLRGRAGRQGDPGSSRFYLSFEDNLMRIFASDRMAGFLDRFGMDDNEPIESGLISRTIENAQRKVEGFNYDARKSLLQYDDVANDQRKVVYAQRNELLNQEDVSSIISGMRAETLTVTVQSAMPPQSIEEQWNVAGLTAELTEQFGLPLDIQGWLDADINLNPDGVLERILQEADQTYQQKCAMLDVDWRNQFEHSILLQNLDSNWKEHLVAMDYMRRGIHLRSYAQKKPEQEYKREAFLMFSNMLENIQREVTSFLMRVVFHEAPPLETKEVDTSTFNYEHADPNQKEEAVDGEEVEITKNQPYTRDVEKVGRNDPCYCGSGKKYKNCHGRLN